MLIDFSIGIFALFEALFFIKNNFRFMDLVFRNYIILIRFYTLIKHLFRNEKNHSVCLYF